MEIMRKPVLQKGQALLIILLILAVGATLVLSLVSRTVTEVAITTKEQESSRAFSAAEAGIEEALLDARTGSFTGSLTGESYSVTVNALSGGTEYAPAQKLFAGDTFPLWFVSHADDGSLTCNGNQCFTGSAIEMCWGEQGIDANSATSPAIELVVFYASTPGRYETVKIARAALDPNASRRASNGFAAPDPGNCTVASKQYAFQKRINFSDLGIPASSYGAQNGLQLARIRFIYNDDRAHGVGIKTEGGRELPAQGKKIESTGNTQEATRKIRVFKLWPDLPPIFDFAVFSTTGLVK